MTEEPEKPSAKPEGGGEEEVEPDEAAEIRGWRDGGREVESHRDLSGWSPPASDAGPNATPSPGLTDNPLSVLTSIMQATLFSDLFCRWSVRRFTAASLPEAVTQMVKKHPTYYKACRWADFLLRGVIVILVLFVVFGATIGLVLQTWYPELLAYLSNEATGQ